MVIVFFVTIILFVVLIVFIIIITIKVILSIESMNIVCIKGVVRGGLKGIVPSGNGVGKVTR